MRYDSEKERLELSSQELAGAIGAMGITLGPLAPARLGAASAEGVRAFEDGLLHLSDAARDLLEQSLTALSDPHRSLKVAAAGGEAWLHRAVYAWSDGGVTMLASRSGGNVIGRADPDEIAGVLTSPLVAGSAALTGDTRVELDGRGVLALVGAADAFRYAGLASLAAHTARPESVSAADVAARMRESLVDDPRWSTSLFASVLPFDAGAFMDGPTLDLALARLASAQLFAVTERSGNFPAHYTPTDEGLVVLDTLAEAGGRVAFTLFERGADDSVGYGSMLLARGTHLMLALDITPEGGGMMALSSASLAQIVSRIVDV
ncbi:hypothetical protein EG835_07625 [bacterium]|nr:hypothetical protein [bacterium]